MATSIIPGILFLLAGIWLLYWVGRRRVGRRGLGGLQTVFELWAGVGCDGDREGGEGAGMGAMPDAGGQDYIDKGRFHAQGDCIEGLRWDGC